MQQLDINKITRTLGIYATPTLKWKSHFEKLREKVVDTMGKLMSTSLTCQQAAIYCNVCVI